MELKGKSFCLYPVKAINIDSRFINEYKPASKISTNSHVCSKLYTPRKVIKSLDTFRGEIHPTKTLLPSKGLIKLTALPEELKDPLNIYPATQYIIQNNQERLYKPKVKDEWKRKIIPLYITPRNNLKNSEIWVPNKSYQINREMTTNDLLKEADCLLNKRSMENSDPSRRQFSIMNPRYNLEKEITRCVVFEITNGLKRSNTHA